MTVSLTEFLHTFKLLHKTQSGFRAGHSCETTLIHMINSWLHAIDNGPNDWCCTSGLQEKPLILLISKCFCQNLKNMV